MERKLLVVMSLALVVCVTGILAGSSPQKQHQSWEYGAFQCGEKWIWSSPGKYVERNKQRNFAIAMGMKNPITWFQVINDMGEQGWELFSYSYSEADKASRYLFKRPR